MTNQFHTRRFAARRAPRVAVASARCISPPAAHGVLPTNLHPRRGISLLEVLISMFVLLFGLMGVAAVFPVGNHYVAKGEQADRGSGLAQAAMADLKARGYLNPQLWYYANHAADDVIGESVLVGDALRFTPALTTAPTGVIGPGHCFVLDPMGGGQLDAVANSRVRFPFAANEASGGTNPWSGLATPLPGTRWPIQRVSLPIPDPDPSSPPPGPYPMSPRIAETVFRLHDDVTNELPKQDDRPAIQRWSVNQGTAPQNEPWRHTLLARQYAGNYSWLATIVPTTNYGPSALQPFDSHFNNELYEVSVAVFNKREVLPSVESERMLQAEMHQGGELQIYDANADVLDAAVDGIRAGQWIAVAGVHPTTGQFLMRWYRILSIDDENDLTTGPNPLRRLMLDGPDWPIPSTATTATDLRAILLPGVISVATQVLPMEAQ